MTTTMGSRSDFITKAEPLARRRLMDTGLECTEEPSPPISPEKTQRFGQVAFGKSVTG